MLSVGCLLALNASAAACAVCMGGDNEQLIDASNTVLWSLLGLVGFIFVATGCTVWYLWRKSQTPVPPDLALIDTLIRTSDDKA
jgi:hypothetical protein